MRWLTRLRPDTADRPAPSAVAVTDGRSVFDVADERSLLDLLRAGPDVMADLAAAALDRPPTAALTDVELASPLQPPCLRDFLCFLDHYRNATGNRDLDPTWERQPAFYFTNPHAVLGPADEVPISPGSTMFDFELEVGAVIGSDGANLHPDEAEAHIAGYLIFCDWSARDLQLGEMPLGLGPAKGKDGATTLGPWLVTADELADRRSGKGFELSMRAWINDEPVTEGSLDRLDWSFPEMVAYASRGTWVRAGDVIGSGTVPMGCLLEHAVRDGEDFRGWLAPGDRVRLEVERLGTLDMTLGGAGPVNPMRATADGSGEER